MSDTLRFVQTGLEEAPPLAPERANSGPLVQPPNAPWSGWTNEDALREICKIMGSEPEVGSRYRVGVVDYPDLNVAKFIGELVGYSLLNMLDDEGRATVQEPVLEFVVLSPLLPPTAPAGTRTIPLAVLPTELWHLSLALPGDLDHPERIDPADVPSFPGSERVQ